MNNIPASQGPTPDLPPWLGLLLQHATCAFLLAHVGSDDSATITYASPSTAQLLGYAAEDIVRLGSTRTLTDEAGWAAALAAVSQARSAQQGSFVYRLRHRSGDWIWVKNSFSVVARTPDRVTIASVLTDVSPEHAVQTELQQTQARLAALVNNAPSLLAQSERLPGGTWRRTYVSENAQRILGYAAEDLMVPGAWDSLLDAASHAARDAATEAAIRTGESSYDLTMRHADGHLVPLRAMVRATRVAEDHWQFTAAMLDQTALRQAEAARAAAEARVSALVNDAPGVLFQSDMAPSGACRRTYISDNVVRLTGHTAATLMQPGRWDAMFEETSLRERERATHEAMRVGAASYECAIRHADGHAVPVRIVFRAHAAADGHWQFTGNLQDISDLHAAHAARSAAEAKVAALLNDSPAVLFEAEQFADGRNVRNFVSDNVVRYLGHTPEYMRDVGSWTDMLDTEGLADRSAAMQEAIRSGHSAFDCWARHADGHRVRMHIAMRATALGENHWRFTGAAHDVTALYEANQARAAAEARVRALVNDAPGVLFQAESAPNGRWRRLFVSDNVVKLLGLSSQHMLQDGAWTALLDDAGRQAHAAAITEAMRNGHAEYDAWARCADGRTVLTRSSFTARQIEPGRWLFTGNLLDITALHEANAARAAAEARVAALVNDAPSALAQYTMTHDGVWRAEFFSDNVARIIGYTPAQLLAGSRAWLVADEESLAARRAGLRQLRQTGQASYDLWLRAADGGNRRIRFAMRGVPAGNGDLRVAATVTDITDLYQANAARAAAEAKLSALINDSPSAIGEYTLGKDGKWRADQFSDNVERITGYTAERLLDPAMIGGILADDDGWQARAAAVQDALKTGKGSYEAWVRHAAGHNIRARFMLRAIPGEDGSWRVIAVLLDVTDLHAANEARAAAEARLAMLVQDGPGVLFQTTLHPDGTWTRDFQSTNIRRLVGFDNEQIDARGGWDTLMDADGIAARAAAVEQAIRTGEGSYEAWLLHADGRRVRVRTGWRALRAADGGWRFTGITLDISDIFAANAARMAAEARLAALVSESPGILFQHFVPQSGPWWRLYMSENVTRIMGYTPEAMLREGAWTALLDEDGRRAQADAVAETIRTGQAEYECWVRHADGHRIRIRTNFRGKQTEDGAWLFTGYGQDVTALYEANAARAAAEARLDLLVQDGPGILFQDQRGSDGAWRRGYVSPNVTALTGYAQSCCLGPLPAAMGAADADSYAIWSDARDRALASGSATCEFMITHAAGHRLWLRASLKGRELEGGAALLTGYATDATRERELTDALAETRRFMEDAAASGPGWLFQLTVWPDAILRVDYVSASVERLTGYSVAEASSARFLHENVEPSAIPMLAENLQRVLRLEPVATEFRLRTKSGAWIWVSETLSPRRRPDGSVQAIGYMTDITQLKERTAQLQHHSRLAMLGEMAAGIAHEIRQPLTAISFAAENADMAMDRGDTNGVRQRIVRIMQQTERANTIIEHLRLFARGADTSANAVPVAVDVLVEGTLTLIGEILRLDNVRVEQAIPEPAPVTMGQQMALEQVLVNLLMNARDALVANRPAETRVVRIAAEHLADRGQIRLTVADNGGGLSAEILPLLFQPFVTTKLAEKGTGLGLSICHSILASLGGEITAQNDPDGAVFTLLLPAAR